MNFNDIFQELGIEILSGTALDIYSPINGKKIISINTDTKESTNHKITKSLMAFKEWRDVPAPKRGELMRIFSDEVRKVKEPLGKLVTIESGKVLQEGLGEVQGMINIFDFAVGLSRQLGGVTLPSEHYNQILQENWLPLGPVGIITAFNFPLGVWAWNAALAIICGDSILWKPSEKTPITAIACQAIFERAIKRYDMQVPKNLSQVVIGHADIGDQIVTDKRIPLISATGSCRMGSIVAPKVAARFGRSLLELGGNNAVIVTLSADLDLAIPPIVSGAVGTTGQRCTTTRRVLVQKDIYEVVFKRLIEAYSNIEQDIGNSPLDIKTLIGPLIDKDAYDAMQYSLDAARLQGSTAIYGGERIDRLDGYYVKPALVKLSKPIDIIYHETFAPITYVMPYNTLSEAIELQNSVMQGLSSAIFTNNLQEVEIFKKYADCGIANVNVGTCGIEIGGAFGGEKDTGGGREAGSDAWKVYMRRQTCSTYYGQ